MSGIDRVRQEGVNIFPVVLCGAGAMLMQVVCLRQFLVVFSGNELIIGIVLASWLALVGAGSLMGGHVGKRSVFAVSLFLAGCLGPATSLFISSVRAVAGVGVGETVPLAAAMLYTMACMAPLCIVTGMAFPLAVAFTGSAAPVVYGIEAIGAFMAGLVFTFGIAGRLSSLMTASVAAFFFVLAAVIASGGKRYLALLLIPLLLYLVCSPVETRLLRQTGDLISRTESRYGEITVFRLRDQFNVYESGKFIFSHPDPQSEELRVFLPLAAHPSPEAILLIGGPPGQLLRLAVYPAARIDYVEPDPALVRVSLSLLSTSDRKAIADSRIRIITEDARLFIKKAVPSYDLIIMSLPDPSTAALNRLYTAEFFSEAGRVLKQGGILSLTLPVSSGYIGRRMRTANGSVFNALRASFSHVELSSEEYGLFLASDRPVDTSPETLVRRFQNRGMKTEQFRPFVFGDAFDPMKVSMVRQRLSTADTLNTDARPVTYLNNLMLWAEVYGRSVNRVLEAGDRQVMTIFGAAAFLCCLAFTAARRTVYFSVLTTGYAAMAFCVVVMLAYQAVFGHVYETLGLLSGVFMAGMAAGALVGSGHTRPVFWLRRLECIGILFFAAAPFLLKTAFSFFFFAAACGILAGWVFAAAAGYDAGVAASGRLYASDLAGSFAGALASAVIFIPVAGIQNTLFGLSFLKVMSLAALLTVRDETR